MRGKDEMRFAGNKKLAADVDTHFHQHIYFFLQRNRINHHAVTDNVDGVITKYSGWNSMQHMLDAIELKRVSCIRSSLESCYHIILRREHINNFSFPFVPPL